MEELWRHQLQPCGLLRLRRNRIHDRLQLPRHPRAAVSGNGDVERTLVFSRTQRHFPRGVRLLPAWITEGARSFPQVSPRPARRRLLERNAGEDSRRARRRFLPLRGRAAVLQRVQTLAILTRQPTSERRRKKTPRRLRGFLTGPAELLQLGFLEGDMLAGLGIVLLDLHLFRHGLLVLGRGIEITGTSRRFELDLFTHGRTPV